MASAKLRVALFNCERLQNHLAPRVYASTGGYLNLLQRAFDHFSKLSSHSFPSIELADFDTMGGHYPADITEFAGVLISGSLSGVYDGSPWISRLLEEIKTLDQKKVKTCGISFGHQAIAQALGGDVQRNPKGSEVSVRSARLTESARKLFGTDKRDFSLHYHHNDTILLLPADFLVLASNNVTEYQSIVSGFATAEDSYIPFLLSYCSIICFAGCVGEYKPFHFLTFCGHPDYSHNPYVLEQLLEYDRQNLWVHEQLIEHGLAILHEPTDYEFVLRQIVRFYAGDLEQASFELSGSSR